MVSTSSESSGFAAWASGFDVSGADDDGSNFVDSFVFISDTDGGIEDGGGYEAACG